MYEIERKFLVKEKKYAKLLLKYLKFKFKPLNIKQAYLNEVPLEFPSGLKFTREEAIKVKEDGGILRIRIQDKEAYLTAKGKTVGISRLELEDKVNYEYGLALIKAQKFLEKDRYKYKRFEIDFFKGNLDGLILIEIELNDEKEEFKKPYFLGEEVSENPKYFNNNLINS